MRIQVGPKENSIDCAEDPLDFSGKLAATNLCRAHFFSLLTFSPRSTSWSTSESQ